MVKIVIATRVVVTILTCSMTGKTIYGKTFVKQLKRNNNNGASSFTEMASPLTVKKCYSCCLDIWAVLGLVSI